MTGARFKYIVFFEILIILFLLPGCFKKEEQVYSLAGEDIYSFAARQGDSTVFKSIGIEMEPGVYQVRVHTASLQEQYVIVDVQSGEPNNHTLATNSVVVYAGNEYTDFEVYVKEHNPAVYICIESKAINGFGVDSLEICKLNWGYRLSLLGMSILFAIIDALLLLRKRIRENKMCTKQQVVFFALLGGVLLAYYPFMRNGFFFGYDTTFHLSRIAFLKDTLLQGAEWPIRIQSTWLYDHGYAVSLFYGDLFLMLPAILMILGVPLMNSYKIFVFCVLLMTAGISYFFHKTMCKG